jgi:hypothetical protein
MRRDYAVILGVVAILLGTAVVGGIVYTYTHRPSALFDAASHLFDRRQLPADL